MKAYSRVLMYLFFAVASSTAFADVQDALAYHMEKLESYANDFDWGPYFLRSSDEAIPPASIVLSRHKGGWVTKRLRITAEKEPHVILVAHHDEVGILKEYTFAGLKGGRIADYPKFERGYHAARLFFDKTNFIDIVDSKSALKTLYRGRTKKGESEAKKAWIDEIQYTAELSDFNVMLGTLSGNKASLWDKGTCSIAIVNDHLFTDVFCGDAPGLGRAVRDIASTGLPFDFGEAVTFEYDPPLGYSAIVNFKVDHVLEETHRFKSWWYRPSWDGPNSDKLMLSDWDKAQSYNDTYEQLYHYHPRLRGAQSRCQVEGVPRRHYRYCPRGQ